jgi:hypothetical protein
MSGTDSVRDELIDRSQGILTSTEREVLIDGEQFEARGREARSRVRRRLGDALLDFIILDEHLPERDLHQIYAPSGDSRGEVRDRVERHLVPGLKAQVKFVYKAAKAGGLEAEQLIEDAVDESKGTRIDKLVKKYERNPQSLTVAELGTLVDAGEIGREEYNALLRDNLEPPEGGKVDASEAASLLRDWDDDADSPE